MSNIAVSLRRALLADTLGENLLVKISPLTASRLVSSRWTTRVHPHQFKEKVLITDSRSRKSSNLATLCLIFWGEKKLINKYFDNIHCVIYWNNEKKYLEDFTKNLKMSRYSWKINFISNSILSISNTTTVFKKKLRFKAFMKLCYQAILMKLSKEFCNRCKTNMMILTKRLNKVNLILNLLVDWKLSRKKWTYKRRC